jgi:4-amino-4-deoxy-L-arabinose transferase-like glycosyltransferase
MINSEKISLSTIGWSLLFMLVLYFPTIHYINHLPIRWWDESLFGLRALHIYKTGDYLSNFQLYDGLMDHRNTKLPFTTWIQVLFMKVLGVKVLALRLPVIMIFLATVAFTLRFAKKNLSAISIGVIFTLVMICSPGIVRDHILRTGDHDMAFLCYLFVMVISYFQYLECNSKKYLGLFATSLIAALLTKNLLAGGFLPGLLLYTIYSKKFTEVLTDKLVWITILSVASVFFGSVFYLNEIYPGFLDRMWGYELMGR